MMRIQNLKANIYFARLLDMTLLSLYPLSNDARSVNRILSANRGF